MTSMRRVLCCLSACLLFLFIPRSAWGATSDIVVTEIAAYEASGHEWVEIFNRGSAAVDLTGWVFWEGETNHRLTLKRGADMSLAPGEYAVITQDDVNFIADYPSVAAKIFDSSWGSLNESGEEIGLKDASGTFGERFTYIAAPNFSLERKDANANDYSSTNWVQHPSGNTVGKVNDARATPASGSGTTGETPASGQGATSVKPVINEFVSNPVVSEKEWIELYSSASSATDLAGWTLEDGVGVIATLNQIIGSGGFLVVELPSNKLNNSGDTIVLKDKTGAVVERIVYGDWDDGNVSDNLKAPAQGKSLARTGTQWLEDETPTRGAANDAGAAPSAPTSSATSSASGTPGAAAPGSSSSSFGRRYASSDVLINELVSDPADGEVEFVELYNRSGETIILDGWWIEEGSETKTMLRGVLPVAGFFVVEEPRGSLNNAGDIVILHDPYGTVIDRLSYGNWDDGNRADNAERPDDPLSLARQGDGQDADNDWYDFALTKSITKGARNVITHDSDNMTQTRGTASTLTASIIINEIYPNPPGSDSEDEFIELKNTGSVVVDLTGWLIGDDSRGRYTLKDGRMEPGGLLALKRSLTGIALNNTGGETALEGQSYARGADGVWSWTTKVTRGQENVIEGANQPPMPALEVETEVAVGEEVTFDASDTTDPEGDTLLFIWDFGDGATTTARARGGETARHEYHTTGVYTVTLRVEDSRKNAAEKRVVITVKDPSAFVGGQGSGIVAGKVEISEFIPDPVGSDEAEFIELFNPTVEEIDLSGFKVDDEDGGSRTYVIQAGTRLGPGEYLVFGKQKTKVVLNNTADAVRLLAPDGSLIQEVAYENVPEGASYVRNEEGKWVWTATLTPGEANLIKTLKHENIKTQKILTASRSRAKPIVATSLEKLRELDVGDRVKVTGVVAVAPGVLGAQYFYIIGPPLTPPSQGGELTAGVQVYQHVKDFPSLSVGDMVKVTGEISEAYGEMRVKVKSRTDIEKLGEKKDLVPLALAAAEIGENVVGALVEVSGEITEKKSSYFYLDDGSEEARVYLKSGAGIERGQIAVGDRVRVVGIVSERNGQYQLLPRAAADIVSVTNDGEEELVLASDPMNKERDLAETYLTATAGGLTSILIGLMARARGALLLGFVKRLGFVALALIRRKG